ncbi:MAG: hypothetical protein Kow00124_22120 [Anaerolineae bacterium]
MSERPSVHTWTLVGTLALVLAWVGIWGSWLPGHSASLSQNAIDFTEWSTYLMDVRSGQMRGMPDLLRGGLALAALALALAGGWVRQTGLRLLIGAAALLVGIMLLPPYPGGLSPAALSIWLSAAYRWQLAAALLTLFGVILAVTVRPLAAVWRCILVMITGGAALALAFLAFSRLIRPFEAHFDRPLGPGWGLVVFAGGLLLATVAHAVTLLSRPRDDEGV